MKAAARGNLLRIHFKVAGLRTLDGSGIWAANQLAASSQLVPGSNAEDLTDIMLGKVVLPRACENPLQILGMGSAELPRVGRLDDGQVAKKLGITEPTYYRWRKDDRFEQRQRKRRPKKYDRMMKPRTQLKREMLKQVR